MNANDDIAEIFGKFHVDKGQATIESDRIRILQDIDKSIGSQKMTETVKKALLAAVLLT